MNQDLIDQDLAEMPLQEEQTISRVKAPSKPSSASEFARSRFDRIGAVLLDIDGTLLDLAPTPREVWVPPETGQRPSTVWYEKNLGRACPRQRTFAERHRPDLSRHELFSGGRRPRCGNANFGG